MAARSNGPWGALPLSFHPFVELAGGERSLSFGFGSVSLSWWNKRATFTLTLGIDGILSAEALVTGDPLPEFRVSGVLRGAAKVFGDPRREALARLLEAAARKRSLAPAEDLPALVQGVLPDLENFAHGVRLTPRVRPGEGLRFMGSVSYLWWAASAHARAYEELRLAGKVAWNRGERSLRVGTQIRARSRAPQRLLNPAALIRLAALPPRFTTWWTPADLVEAMARRPWPSPTELALWVP